MKISSGLLEALREDPTNLYDIALAFRDCSKKKREYTRALLATAAAWNKMSLAEAYAIVDRAYGTYYEETGEVK